MRSVHTRHFITVFILLWHLALTSSAHTDDKKTIHPVDQMANKFYHLLLTDSSISPGLPSKKHRRILKQYLTPELINLLEQTAQMEKRCIAATAPGDKPDAVETGVLINNYEPADEVALELARRSNKTMVVDATLIGIDKRFPKAHIHRADTWSSQLVFTLRGKHWRISNIRFAKGQSLQKTLQKYIDDGKRWCMKKPGRKK